VRPLLSVTVILAVLGVASACGSGNRDTAVLPPPRLPRAVAAPLADRSDALAAALRRGDACEARIQVHGLERQTRLAIEAGRIPTVYRARLQTAVLRLATGVPPCVPTPRVAPAPPPPPGHGKDHGHHKGKGKKHGDGGDEQ
jgi:hypothetical protein